ncbi:MAG TPA: NmrA family NAD(P)-binding protein, partial [Flavisolibacter sp.]|nr:NmrA family NAD(P)-binding protein [Flavisolibacter sp.]
LAARYGVQHFVYSSVAGADLKTGIPHFESKSIIENHIRKISLPFTIIRPTSLYENFLIPQVNRRLLKGKLGSPINEDVMQQLTSAEDIGKIAAGIFSNKDAFQGQTITVATEEMNLQQVANIFSKVMGKKIVYQKLPMIITRLVMGKDLHKMFKWINKNGGTFLKNIDLFKKGHPDLLSLEAWAESHFTKPLH